MASDDHSKFDKVVVNQEILDEQIADLEKHSVVHCKQDPAANVRTTLYLGWPDKPESDTRALTLGMYARWLIAARLLLKAQEATHDLSILLEKNNACVRQLFSDVSENRRIKNANRYNPKAIQPSGDKLSDVLLAIISKLNELYEKYRQNGAITIDEFFSVFIPLSPLQDAVGGEPIKSFEQWLKTGKRRASSVSHDSGSSGKTLQRKHPQIDVIRGQILTPATDTSAHKLIINVHCSESLQQLADFAVDLEAALTDDMSVISIRLSEGASRVDVLTSLYKGCLLAFSPADLAARPIDLASDLQPIRDFLTNERVVVIFSEWDNVEGPFEALHDYLCNTHWGELIRILAQPSQKKLLSTEHPLDFSQSTLDPMYRIVVLSSHLVNDLAPWLLCAMPLKVAHDGDALEISSIIDGLDASKKTWFSSQMHFFGVPDAIEVFLISSLSGNGLGEIAREYGQLPILNGAKPARKLIRLGLMKKWLDERNLSDLSLAFFKFTTASIIGMQRSTMQRCIKQLSIVTESKFPSLTDVNFDAVIQTFISEFSFLLEEVPDEHVEGLSGNARPIELDATPHVNATTDYNKHKPQSIRFRTREWSSVFAEAWLNAERDAKPPIGYISWKQINFVLAEECLRQATVQMHHLEAGAMDNAYATRRVVQTIYHGLMSLGFTTPADESENFFKEGLFALALPTEREKRYRYLYTFLYRQCVEEGNWRLGRAFGRSDVRLDLLTMFIKPENGHLMVTGIFATDKPCLLPAPYTVEAQPLPDPILRCDLLEALGRAGLDHCGNRGRNATIWALSMLPGYRLTAGFGPDLEKQQIEESWQINALIPSRDSTYYLAANAALRLRLDFLQTNGTETDLIKATALCDEQLMRIGLGKEFLVRVRDNVATAIKMARKNGSGGTEKLNETLHNALAQIQAHAKSHAARQGVSDILSRLGKVIATRAHNKDDERHQETVPDVDRPHAAIWDVAEACAICWLADRLRSAAGTSADSGVQWPVARARSLRYYVRVCLKLARLVIEGDTNSANKRSWNFAEGLLGHAQNRLGVYTRHHFRFRRERVSMLLLDSARVRSWTRMNLHKAQTEFNETENTYKQHCREIDGKLDQTTGKQSTHNKERIQIMRLEKQARESKANKKRLVELEKLFATAKTTESALLLEKKKLDDDFMERMKEFKDAIDAQCRTLKEGMGRANEAEDLLLSLGFQAPHVRRLYLERIKNANALVDAINLHRKINTDITAALKEEARKHLYLAKAALSALNDVSIKSEFWKQIHNRQTYALARAQRVAAAW